MAHIILSKFGGAHEDIHGTVELLNYLDNVKFSEYNDISDTQCDEIDGYLKEFGYKFVKGSVVFGWIYQIFKSVGSGKFIFSPEAFKTDIDELDSIDLELYSRMKHITGIKRDSSQIVLQIDALTL